MIDRDDGTVGRPDVARDRYQLQELAEMLGASGEELRVWLREAGIHPVTPGAPDEYGLDAFEFIRTRQHGI